MKKLIEEISSVLQSAFEKAGFDAAAGTVTLSNRPDLCMYQCNGALSLAKAYKTAPIKIAQSVLQTLEEMPEKSMFSSVEAVMPGFININVSDAAITDYLKRMAEQEHFGAECEKSDKIVIDYGGPNVAKPLHVGHLRSAVIGESLKRILRFLGNDVTGDAHLGDWGLQIGLIITELKERRPELVYFDENYTGEYPSEPPFTMSELEEIYPAANVKSKENEEFKNLARTATFELQSGRAGYRALWKHIMEVSVADLKKNYEKLDVSFDVWGKESDVQDIIPGMVEKMKAGGFAHYSEGALVVDVKEDTDTKEMPPCMILKSDGATLYNTTDLATIVDRVAKYNPDRIIYLADARQSLYFEQVFRCARKTGLVTDAVRLDHVGFGTMNGKDGKPFKTRDGGVMRLEYLIGDVTETVKGKMADRDYSPEEIDDIAAKVGLAAIKYGDLSNQPGKDYVFDLERFTSFDGNTGPYILYTAVRIKSILARVDEAELKAASFGTGSYEPSPAEISLKLKAAAFADSVYAAAAELAPYRICQYLYELSDAFNGFYHENHILTEENAEKKSSWLALISLCLRLLNTGINLLGFDAPERM